MRNVQTGKCLTIAGGESTDNNVVALQFDCDSHPSRTWRIDDVTGSGINQIRNVQTGKCLTIAGGTLADNNIRAVQFNCDDDLSRRWTIRLSVAAPARSAGAPSGDVRPRFTRGGALSDEVVATLLLRRGA
jgi:hypothetical protein